MSPLDMLWRPWWASMASPSSASPADDAPTVPAAVGAITPTLPPDGGSSASMVPGEVEAVEHGSAPAPSPGTPSTHPYDPEPFGALPVRLSDADLVAHYRAALTQSRFDVAVSHDDLRRLLDGFGR